MSLISQHSLILNDPALSALLLITAFTIIIAACLVAIHLRDKALREILDEAFAKDEELAELPKDRRKDLVILAMWAAKGKRNA